MKYYLASSIILLSACSSIPLPVARTKFSDKTMRIMIDPASVSVEDHVRLQNALAESGKWIVIDRAAGFAAIKKEQEMLHRTSSERFEDKEKYAMWGKLYGAGGVVVAHTQCSGNLDLWHSSPQKHCAQFINLLDTNTGEVIVSVEGEGQSDENLTPGWKETVQKLNDAYPEAFEVFQKHNKLVVYEQESKESAVRQKEELTSQQLDGRGLSSTKSTP